ncbi:MAG: phage terminase large subunit [Magnetococcales bacterium]|nr:phage terminase large subunit [Magnetococcales bacterium]
MKSNPKRFMGELAQEVAGMRKRIEAGVDGFDPDPRASRERCGRACGDLEYFARTYFPHYIQKPNSRLHAWLYRELPDALAGESGCRLALAAPRGEAKSTIACKILTLWAVITGRKHYVCLVADVADQASVMLESIKAELEFNPRLLADFPDAAGAGRVWQTGVILTRNNRKIQAFGSGKRMRGLSHGPHRPDLTICDDLENDENVRSPEQRDKLENWLRRTVLYLGAADDSMDLILIGTVLHYDSVLSRLLSDPLWRSVVFKSVVTWPGRMDLWDRWEEVLLNEGIGAARRFYDARSGEMEAGAVVSWPAARPLYALMVQRARDGHAAFDSEQQNDPVSGEENPFSGKGVIQFWVERDPDWIFYGGCDPSMGLHGNSRDPCALLVCGLNRATGRLDVVEARIGRMVPDRIIEEIIALQIRYGCVLWWIEAVQFQMMLHGELVKRSAARGVPVPAMPIRPHTDKTLRIESLQPHVTNGLIRFHPSQTTLVEQLRHFPKADHDDGPDALHMVWQGLREQGGPIEFRATGPRVLLDEAPPVIVDNGGWGAVGDSLDWCGY